jgi:transketolase
MTRAFGPRRATWVDVETAATSLDPSSIARLERFDLVYRSVCSMMFNFTQSGHPGGSVSSGRIVTSLLFEDMDYDIGQPDRPDADIISYAAGHKALGLYAMLALRDEIVRQTRPDLLPEAVALRMRLEDLLGFRRNPTHPSPLFKEFGSKPLDGHPTPATPFIKIATGPSGVGVGTSLGLAVAARDYYGSDAPRVHIIEGEGGLTPGRVVEALAFAGTAGLSNAVMHLDWNQASIDSDSVTREGDHPGDYVQWDPMELFFLHDWNVIQVHDGFDVGQVLTAQKMVAEMGNGQPTAIVYRTVKGWRYGIEGKKSHGGGHKTCSEGYFDSMRPLFGDSTDSLPRCDGSDPVETEAAYWATLQLVRGILEDDPVTPELGDRVSACRDRLEVRDLTARPDAPDVAKIYEVVDPTTTPPELALEIGSSIALRQQLGKVLGYLNTASNGAVLIAAADLLGSTAISSAADGFPTGFFHADTNPGSRTLSIGGICEDGMTAVSTGISGFGHHVGACASYAAFIAPLGHIASRLHAISSDMRSHIQPGPYNPYVIVCGHAGMKTGEDGPTHADPQALQLFQENFVAGTALTLTPWEPQEIWPLLAAAFAARPAVIAPFVTRPGEPVLDRAALGLAPAIDAIQGMYRLRSATGTPDATIVLQGSEVTYAFVQQTMPLLAAAGIDLDVYLVTCAEMFDGLGQSGRDAVFSQTQADTAMGITGFTRPTMYRWIRSDLGRAHTMYPFAAGHYLGSGAGDMVVHEAGLDGEGQFAAIKRYLEALATST